MAGRPTEKATNFGPSLRRLLGHLRPERALIGLVVVMAAAGVAFTVVGPKLIGRATDIIFAGVIGKSLPATVTVAGRTVAVTKDMVIEGLRSYAQGGPAMPGLSGGAVTPATAGRFADMLQGMNVVPGQGIQFTALGTVLGLALGLYLLSGLLMWGQAYILNGVVQRSVYRLREEVAGKINRLPLSYFDRQPRGELLSRVTNDIDNIAQTLQQTLSQLLNGLLTILGVGVMMFVVSPVLGAIAIAAIPVSVVLVSIIGKQSQKQFVLNWRYTGELNGRIEEAYTGHSLVTVFGRRHEAEAAFAESNDQLYGAGFRAQFISGIIMPTMFFVGNLSYVAVAVVGGLRVASGQMQLGDVQAFIQYSRMFTQPITQVASMANLLQSGVASAERVFEVLDATEESADAPGQLNPTRGRVEFESIDFSYDPQKPLITDLSLVAEPGHTIAIVGPTGAGKTTLVNLIMRFYELQAGRITLDGVDITSVPRHALRQNIGMVLQDTWLFHGTIRDNIAYGNPDASEGEILAAARATYVDRFVHSLPDGYDTVIDEEGSNISAGEKQLLTIARAFLADPALLILDEATSSVDTRTELLVQRAMNALRKDRTSFVIAHRLSTIRDADTILVMEHGRIVEQGDHQELLAREGAYYRLYRSQFEGAIEAEVA
ncbi:ABC transporter ATP-binding protein [Raineyella sp. LH-20]|nr:ABC transporter ATP-binding protein [Raineyella sp. LH-20]WOP20198.1 ABC transporter ATP-binding protein [Raineyella sp. LH-20]